MRNKRKVPYEDAKLEILLLNSMDIITTSGPMAGGTNPDNDDNWDPEGWV